MRIRNLTPHALAIIADSGQVVLTIQPEATAARAAEIVDDLGVVDVDGVAVPLRRVRLGEVTGLPEQQDGTLLFVSRIVADACPGRDDLIVPGELVRDARGQIVGARTVARVR